MDFVVALAIVLGPAFVVLLAGLVAAVRSERLDAAGLGALVVITSIGWMIAVGLLPHESPCARDGVLVTKCPTVFGYDSPLENEHPVGTLIVLGTVLISAVWAGCRRIAPAASVGAAVIAGPLFLAWWTAPRGDNDGLWMFLFLGLAFLGLIGAFAAAIAERVSTQRRISRRGVAGEAVPATAGDRITALAIDTAVVGAILVVPLTMLSHAELEMLAFGVGIAAATTYLAVPVTTRGASLGQAVVGLSVRSIAGRTMISPLRATVRSLIVVLEVVGAATIIFGLPALIEMVALTSRGRTITDRVLGTSVLAHSKIPAQAAPSTRQDALERESWGPSPQS